MSKSGCSLVDFLSTKHRYLSNIDRFNVRPTSRKESVAEHSYYVSAYSYCLARDLGIDDINMSVVLSLALFHDYEECEFGDILFPSKSEVKREYEKLRLEKMKDIFSPSTLNSIFFSPTFSRERLIVEFCDKLESFVYCVEEVILGNVNFIGILNANRARLKSIALRDRDLWRVFKRIERGFSEKQYRERITGFT